MTPKESGGVYSIEHVIRQGAFFFTDFSSSLLDLFFPGICMACEEQQAIRNHLYCVHCTYEISATQHWDHRQNEFTQKFVGRIPIEQGASLYKFVPGGLFQKVIHKLKYQSRPEIGVHLGRIAGREMKKKWDLPDMIIPVPIHPQKLWTRGYNQAERIAYGISQELSVPVHQRSLAKVHMTKSQTGFHRMERMNNVEDAFKLMDHKNYSKKHILLVDDVLTTGATLEACAKPLVQIPNIRISMFTLAIGQL